MSTVYNTEFQKPEEKFVAGQANEICLLLPKHQTNQPSTPLKGTKIIAKCSGERNRFSEPDAPRNLSHSLEEVSQTGRVLLRPFLQRLGVLDLRHQRRVLGEEAFVSDGDLLSTEQIESVGPGLLEQTRPGWDYKALLDGTVGDLDLGHLGRIQGGESRLWMVSGQGRHDETFHGPGRDRTTRNTPVGLSLLTLSFQLRLGRLDGAGRAVGARGSLSRRADGLLGLGTTPTLLALFVHFFNGLSDGVANLIEATHGGFKPG